LSDFVETESANSSVLGERATKIQGFDILDQEEVPSELLQIKIEDLESQKYDITEELERTKGKARSLLMKKELQELRLKQTLGKLESYLKSEAAGSLT